MNGLLWNVRKIDPHNPKLVDRTGILTVAVTDPLSRTVYLSKSLRGEFLNTVFIHELGHCALVSFGLLEYIHERVDPRYWVDVEEFMCNFIADYGLKIFRTAYFILGDKALEIVPKEIEKYIA